MPGFRFRLQSVLDHRVMVEQEHQRAVAEIERERSRLEGAIREFHRGIEHEKDELRSRLAPDPDRPSDMREARLQGAVSLRLMAAAQRAVVELAGVHKRLEGARVELLEAVKRRKAVELLRARRYDEWRLAENRRDAADMDELAVIRGPRRGDDQ